MNGFRIDINQISKRAHNFYFLERVSYECSKLEIHVSKIDIIFI